MKTNIFKTSTRFGIGLMASMLLFNTYSVLANHHGDGEKRAKRGAPREAIEACANLQVDDVCQFEGRRGEVSGVCITPPEEKQVLVCKSSRPRGKGRGEPEEQG